MRSPARLFLSMVLGGIALLIVGGLSSDQQVTVVTLLVDPDCRDGGDIYLDDGTRWTVDHRHLAPMEWRDETEIAGMLTTGRGDRGWFDARDGTRLQVTNGFRKASCSLWE